ncbi:tail completion protein gp17 [Pseudooceanicola sp. 200-1SW]|uniref:tail completion protein gp17 n=1 Tax=Pseudooceanicola sp. 200-1SW TaxID=3425949 RepID=UPI003D7F7D26
MKAALTALLLSDPALQARVGARVNWSVPPAHAGGFPCLGLTLINAPTTYTLEGEAEVQRSNVQVDAWAVTAADAEALRAEVQGLLSGFRGVVAGVRFRGAFLRGARDLDGRSLGDLGPLFGVSIDLTIRWSAG